VATAVEPGHVCDTPACASNWTEASGTFSERAAAILNWRDALGTLALGERADLLVVRGTAGDRYTALLAAREPNLALVVIDGVCRVGPPALMRRFSRSDERLRVGGRERLVDLTQDAADPAVDTATLAEAGRQLTDALAHHPELAPALESGGVPPAVRALAGATPTWYLELDEMGSGGPELRPRLPFGPARPPTGPRPEAEPVRAREAAALDLLAPVTLDPLTVASDPEYLDTIAAEPNVPEFAHEALRQAGA
jgi:5-methylthioadenosine/S-adenosylhomocysteine deaminase